MGKITSMPAKRGAYPFNGSDPPGGGAIFSPRGTGESCSAAIETGHLSQHIANMQHVLYFDEILYGRMV
jgi:hypothetical protein